MDRLILHLDSVENHGLCSCVSHGVAYQSDMKKDLIVYDDEYYDHYKALEGTAVAKALNAGRCELVARHAPAKASVWDVGAGCGTFIKAARERGFDAKGYDVMPRTRSELKNSGQWADTAIGFKAVTFWDSLEHLAEPEHIFKNIERGAFVFVALPIFTDIDATTVRASKHFKPGEHLYYWTADGFVKWMTWWGFRLVEISDHEVRAGREAIGSFVFCRDLPDQTEYLEQYKQMHFERFYGSSATELHLSKALSVVKDLRPRSIMDYGCGRSDLVAHFYRDGERRIERYDPAIRALRHMPEGTFDLVLCCDVMEHIPMPWVDLILRDIESRCVAAFFTISTKLARAKLPNGQNAHVTLLTKPEWMKWVNLYFKKVYVMSSEAETDLAILAKK